MSEIGYSVSSNSGLGSTIAQYASQAPEVDSLAYTEAAALSVSYYEEPTTDEEPASHQTSGPSSKQPGGGGGTDENGLQFPSFGFDIKELMLALGTAQSAIADDQADFSAEQIDFYAADQIALATENVEELAEARQDAENAAFWTDLAQGLGWAGPVLTILGGLATGTLPVAIAGVCMLGCMAASEAGVTDDVISALGGGDSVMGTIVLGAAIIGASAMTGGVAGLTILSTLTPGLLTTSENLQELGLSSEAAMWVSLSIGIGFALLGGIAATGMGSNASQAVDTGSDAAQIADTASDAAKAASQTADGASDTTGAATTAGQAGTTAANSASNVAGAADDATNVVNCVDEVAEAAEETASLLRRIVQSVSNNRFARFVSEPRLEKALQSSFEKVLYRASEITTDAAQMSVAATRLNKITMFAQAVLDLLMGTATWIKTDFAYQSDVHSADAEVNAADADYASNHQAIWNSLLGEQMGNFTDNVGTTADVFHVIDSATAAHLNA